jgi:hypothetical protein
MKNYYVLLVSFLLILISLIGCVSNEDDLYPVKIKNLYSKNVEVELVMEFWLESYKEYGYDYIKSQKPFYNFSEKRTIKPGEIEEWGIKLPNEYGTSLVEVFANSNSYSDSEGYYGGELIGEIDTFWEVNFSNNDIFVTRNI